MLDQPNCLRTRELRQRLLSPDGPSVIYQRYFDLHGCFPDWGLSPYQVIDAIVVREKQLGLDGQERQRAEASSSRPSPADRARGIDAAVDGS